jgi:hypothetical protein
MESDAKQKPPFQNWDGGLNHIFGTALHLKFLTYSVNLLNLQFILNMY